MLVAFEANFRSFGTKNILAWEGRTVHDSRTFDMGYDIFILFSFGL